MPLSYPLDDPRDDDVTIGSILKRSATTNSRLPGTLLRNHSIKELVKSTSNTWNKNLNDPQPAQPNIPLVDGGNSPYDAFFSFCCFLGNKCKRQQILDIVYT